MYIHFRRIMNNLPFHLDLYNELIIDPRKICVFHICIKYSLKPLGNYRLPGGDLTWKIHAVRESDPDPDIQARISPGAAASGVKRLGTELICSQLSEALAPWDCHCGHSTAIHKSTKKKPPSQRQITPVQYFR